MYHFNTSLHTTCLTLVMLLQTCTQVMTLLCILLTWAIKERRQAYHVPACFSVHMLLNHLYVVINCPTPGIQEVYTLVQRHVIRVVCHPLSAKDDTGHFILMKCWDKSYILWFISWRTWLIISNVPEGQCCTCVCSVWALHTLTIDHCCSVLMVSATDSPVIHKWIITTASTNNHVWIGLQVMVRSGKAEVVYLCGVHFECLTLLAYTDDLPWADQERSQCPPSQWSGLARRMWWYLLWQNMSHCMHHLMRIYFQSTGLQVQAQNMY